MKNYLHHCRRLALSLLLATICMSSCAAPAWTNSLSAMAKALGSMKPDEVNRASQDDGLLQTMSSVNPAALMSVARLLENRALGEASLRFLEAQIRLGSKEAQGSINRAFLPLAVEDWLRVATKSLAWQSIILKGPGFFALLDPTDSDELRDTYSGALLKALLALGKRDDARSLLDQSLARLRAQPGDQLPLGSLALPDWLLLGRLQIHMQDGKFVEDSVPDLVAAIHDLVVLRETRPDLLQFVDSFADLDKLFQGESALELKLLELKASLSGAKPEAAWTGYAAILAEAPSAAAFRKIAGTSGFVQRDLYDAARFAGRFSDGIAQLKLIDEAIGTQDGRLRVYNHELQGRLLRSKHSWYDAQRVFETTLTEARRLEKAGELAAIDRRRIQWYALSSLVNQSDVLGEQPLFGVADFLRDAQGIDDTDYFYDVLEEAIADAGARQNWGAVSLLLDKLRPSLQPILVAKCQALLARAGYLGLAGAPKKDAASLAGELRKSGPTLYYRALGAWMLGDGIDVLTTLQDIQDDGWKTASSQDGAVEYLVRGLITSGLYGDAENEYWPRRSSLSRPFLVSIAQQLSDAGQYRFALRVCDYLRANFGYPVDVERLKLFNPRPFETELLAAVQPDSIPDWIMYAMVRTESNFDSVARSGPGAKGLAQLMPDTADQVAKSLKIPNADIYDPATNLRLGAAYLSAQYKKQASWPKALAAYNAGPSRIKQWIAAGLPADDVLFLELVPILETRNYIRRIAETALVYAALYKGPDPGLVLQTLLARN